MRLMSTPCSTTIFLLCGLFLLKVGKADYFCATSELGKALEAGRRLGLILNDYIHLEDERLNQIRRLIKRLTLEFHSRSEFESYYANPLNSYSTVKRLADDWKWELANLGITDGCSVYKSDQMADIISNIKDYSKTLPDMEDAMGAARAILRLQDVYDFKTSDLAHGILTEGVTRPMLTFEETLVIGREAYDANEFERAEQWFRAAYDRLREELESRQDSVDDDPHQVLHEDDGKFKTIDILDRLSYALGRQGRYSEALDVMKEIYKLDSEDEHINNNILYYESHLDMGEGRIGPEFTELSKFSNWMVDYAAMCRGEKVFPGPPKRKLKCRNYVPHPYYTIGPVKEEILHPEPKVVMWHDAIHPEEIEQMKKLAEPLLYRAKVINSSTGKTEITEYRTSKSAWISRDSDEIARRINERLHIMTKLNAETTEDLQVQNFGISGHYEPHYDFIRNIDKNPFGEEIGNRMASLLYYLTDVEMGGGTVFDLFGLSVTPTKGSALFWWNLHPSGAKDYRMRYGECPVLFGSKWVMNVWLHEGGQEFKRPCATSQSKLELKHAD